MNYKRILIGGLAAGVLINISEFILNGVVLADAMEADMARTGLTMASWAIPAYVVMAFLFGLLLAWCYAAIRPRFGAGPGTALIAAGLVWTLGYVLPAITPISLGLTSVGNYVLALVWGAAELIAGALLAAWLYRETESAASAAHSY